MRHLLPLLLLAAAVARADDPPKDGDYVEKWPDGKTKLEAHYKDGKLYGLLRRWYENGQLAAYSSCAAWWENGQLQMDWQYHEGKLCEGTWKSFHANGAFWTSWRMGPGGKAPTQTQVSYYDDGKVEYRGRWKDELQDGKWEYFRRDGTRSEVRRYRKGQLDGWVTKWDEEGKVTSRQRFKNGKPKE